MTRPRLLDLFCCEGGAGEGYRRAGFDVTGIDVEARFVKRYPGTFVQADALEYLAEHGHEFDAIHASPPCQAYSITKHSHSNVHPELVEPTREALTTLGIPWIMENVPGAPMVDPITLCGTQFGLLARDADGAQLHLRRHRLFESSEFLMGPGVPCRCLEYRRAGIGVGGVYGNGCTDRRYAKDVRRGGYTPVVAIRKELMGIDWMTQAGLSQSLPPAYTEFLGRQIIDGLARAA